MFDDRIEVYNPCTLPPSVSLKDAPPGTAIGAAEPHLGSSYHRATTSFAGTAALLREASLDATRSRCPAALESAENPQEFELEVDTGLGARYNVIG
jgi:hypothetical protein